jgi:hypothetical protein
MPDFEVESMKKFIGNFEESITGNPNIKEFKKIKEDKANGYFLMYYVVNMGVMSDRDCVCEVTYHTRENGDFVSIVKTVDHKDHP